MATLILKRASASRPSGEWNDDDFDVRADGAVIGRIFNSNSGRLERPGGGRWRLDTTKIEAQRTAVQRRARTPWPPSLRVGGYET
jgi:hypothetical protein